METKTKAKVRDPQGTETVVIARGVPHGSTAAMSVPNLNFFEGISGNGNHFRTATNVTKWAWNSNVAAAVTSTITMTMTMTAESGTLWF